MNTFNRIIALLLWLILLIGVGVVAVLPLRTVRAVQSYLGEWETHLLSAAEIDATNFLVGQIAVGVVGLLIFGFLISLTVFAGRRQGVRIRTAQGSSAELDTTSISRRLTWHLDQMSEVISVVPLISARGGAVNIKLEIETAPDIDVPMKTDEVVAATREIIEQDMGLKLGKLDVHVRYAPFDPEWVQ
ncbi:MAG: hypothetical protein WDZ49_16870 [Litorilinea sp.]